MAVSPRLEVRQTQQLTMTRDLRQAIGLLRLTSQELRDFVDAEVEGNPFLELDADAPAEGGAEERVGPTSEIPLGLGSYAGPDQAAPDLGLRDSLLGQLRMMDADPTLLVIAARLVEELEDDGYLRLDLREVSLALERPLPQVEEALQLVQSCEPTGVGARALTECFGLQLREMRELTPLSMKVLTKLALYTEKGAASVAREIGAKEDEVEAVMMLVRTLDPAPGHSVRPEPVQMALPDVAVIRDNMGGWTTEMLRGHQPKLALNSEFSNRASAQDADAANYVSNQTRRANWLIRSLEQRSRTIGRVASEIVRVQAGFFESGPARLVPLTLKDVAEKLSIHESTVSRVTRGKYLTCERGTFELKYFFSKAISGLDGQGDRSALAVRDRIRQMIADEAVGRPLSDDAIASALKGEGIEIARRTVAKYRESMRIPASHARRRMRHREPAILLKTGGRWR